MTTRLTDQVSIHQLTQLLKDERINKKLIFAHCFTVFVHKLCTSTPEAASEISDRGRSQIFISVIARGTKDKSPSFALQEPVSLEGPPWFDSPVSEIEVPYSSPEISNPPPLL